MLTVAPNLLLDSSKPRPAISFEWATVYRFFLPHRCPYVTLFRAPPPRSTLFHPLGRDSHLGLSGVLALGMVYYLVAYVTGTYTVFDVASLIVHEAGHFFFRSFGWTLFLLGGSLFQLLLPALFVYSFLRSRCRPGVQVALAWLGQNAMNVSVYAADAQERVPPLITGDPATHDWWQLLRAADLPAYDDVIGDAFFAVGLLAFGAALLAPRVLP